MIQSMKYLSLKDLPPFLKESHLTSDHQVFLYLEKLCLSQKLSVKRALLLPSLIELKNYLQVEVIDISKALNKLYQQGILYELTGFNTPVPVWRHYQATYSNFPHNP